MCNQKVHFSTCGHNKSTADTVVSSFLRLCLKLLYIKTEVHHIPVLANVILTLDVDFAGFAAGGFTSVVHEVLKLDDFGTDETFLKIGMDDASTLGAFIPCGMSRHELPALLR